MLESVYPDSPWRQQPGALTEVKHELPGLHIRVCAEIEQALHEIFFLDVGGSASAKRVEAGFRIILKDPNVKAILVNIFGGIVRCDRVAQGVVDAYNNIGEINVPIIVRLQGTNAEEGKKIIDESGLKVHSAITLLEAADLVTKVLS